MSNPTQTNAIGYQPHLSGDGGTLFAPGGSSGGETDMKPIIWGLEWPLWHGIKIGG